jgi:transcriptional regulator with XRE-family HTH domain
MPKGLRGYSTSFVAAVAHGCLSDLMFQFVHECLVREIPVSAVAERLGVTRATVYSWFTGRSEPRVRHQEKIKQILARWNRA